MNSLVPSSLLGRTFGLLAGTVALVSLSFTASYAQNSAKSRVSIEVVREGKNTSSANDSTFAGTLLLRERTASLFRRDSAFQAGSIAIRRNGGDLEQLLVVAYAAEYLDSLGNVLPNTSLNAINLPQPLPTGAVASPAMPAPTPVAINTFQGDLSPTTTDPNGNRIAFPLGSITLPNTANILPGQTQVLLRFTARWSDQSLQPRTAGLQGRRFVRLRLLQALGNTYELGATLATVVLDDPLRVGPVIMNAIQDKNLARNVSDVIELESPQFRSDGLPGTVFYDENYNAMTYTAFSSDASSVTVQALQSDTRFAGRPSLFYVVQPGAIIGSRITLTVIANDGTGMLARDEFDVTVVQNTTSVKSDEQAQFVASPNPATERLSVKSTAKTTGIIRTKVSSLLGETLQVAEQSVSAGAEYRQELDLTGFPSGVYMVEVQDGASRSVRKVVKQ